MSQQTLWNEPATQDPEGTALGHYRRVDQRVWGDAKFDNLSTDAKLLWFFILTGPHHNGLPGLHVVGAAASAEALRWEPALFTEAWDEIETSGMAEANWRRRVVFVPNALKYQPPENPNAVKAWAKLFDVVPECELRERWLQDLIQTLAPFRPAWLEPFRELLPERLRERFGEQFREPLPEQSESESESETEKETGSEGAVPAPAADRDLVKRQKWEALTDKLRGWASENDVAHEVVEVYLDRLESGVADFYESHGGRMTWTRKAFMADRLKKLDPEIALAAVELYVDKSAGTKDERYVGGIARRLDRLSDKEREAEMRRHRTVHKGRGIFSEMFGGES